MNFKDFWIDNKRFLITVGGALVVFFFVGKFARGYGEGAETTRNRSRRERRDIIALHKDLKNSYWLEEAKVSAYEKQEADLRAALGAPDSTELDGQREEDLGVKFDQAIARVWQVLRQRASDVGIRLPDPVSSEEDFGAGPDYGIEEYRVLYSYLRVVRLSLEALIEARVTEIGDVSVLAPDHYPIRENVGELVCRYRGVSVPVTGTYDSLLRVLELVQKPGDYLQVRLRNIKSVKARNSEDQLLRGDIEFYGISFAEPPLEEDTSGRSRRDSRRRRRR